MLINSISNPSPLLEDEDGTESSKFIIIVETFLVTSPHPEAIQKSTKSGLIRIKDPLIMHITQEIASVLGALCQELGETKYIFFYYVTKFIIYMANLVNS